jgi:hypothetical protein
MKEISAWLLHDDQKDLFEIVTAISLNVIFLALAALILWIFDREIMALRLARGYGVLWLAAFVTAILLGQVQRYLRVNLYDRSNVYLVSNLVTSIILQAGWAAFAALTLGSFVDGVSGWMIVVLYLIGAFSCIIAFYAVSSFYQGHFYRLISLPLALISFIVFSVWPASGDLLYGWFFDLF